MTFRRGEIGVAAFVAGTCIVAALGALGPGGWPDLLAIALILAYIPIGLIVIGAAYRQWSVHSWRLLVPLLLLLASLPLVSWARLGGARLRHERFVRDIPAYERALERLEKDTSFQAGPVPPELLPPSAYQCCSVVAASRDSSGHVRAGFLVGRHGGYVFDRMPPRDPWKHYEQLAPQWYRVWE
jgi:hypothetical protein